MPFLLYEKEAAASSVKTVDDLSPPNQSHFAILQAETGVIRFTLDGSTPSATSGTRLINDENPIEIEISRFKQIKFIREGSNAVLHVHYYAGNVLDSVLYAPVITGVPTISGDTGLGDTLTATPAPVAAYPAPTTVLQWTRDGSDIPGALGTTYTIVEADQPSDIRVRQTSTNSEGSDTATSDATAIPSSGSYYLRPDGVSAYLRPDGVSRYRRPS